MVCFNHDVNNGSDVAANMQTSISRLVKSSFEYADVTVEEVGVDGHTRTINISITVTVDGEEYTLKDVLSVENGKLRATKLRGKL